jgi:DNA-binding PadR family transcriptional regulator
MPTDPDSPPKLVDPKVLKAQSHPVRAAVLNILSEGPNSPARIHQRLKGKMSLTLNGLCHHIDVLRNVGLIELTEVKLHGGRKEHIYRATQRQYFDRDEWLAVDAEFKMPIISTIFEQVSDDVGQAMSEGKIADIPDIHLSRSPVELDAIGWREVSDLLRGALRGVLEAHARSAERCQESGEEKTPVRVIMMLFPIGREERKAD